MSRDNRRQAKLYAREQRRLAYQRRHEPPANDASDILEHLLQAVEESRTDDEAQEHLASIRDATVRRVLADVQPKDVIAVAIERAAYSPGGRDTDREVKALLDAARHGKAEAEADEPSSVCAGDIPQAAPYACSKVADIILDRLEKRYGTEAGRVIATTYAAAQKPLPMSLPVSVLASCVLEECSEICEPTTYERMSVEEVQSAAREVYHEIRGLLRAELIELEEDDSLTRYEGLRFGRVDGVRHETPVTYETFKEDEHPRGDDGKFKSGSGSARKTKDGSKAEGKVSKTTTSKPHASPTSPHVPGTAKPKRPSVDDVHEHIERIKHSATPEAVAELASHMEQMTVKQLHELKRKHGLRAGGRKADLVRKVSERAVAKVSRREFFTREARKKGLRPADAHKLASVNRKVHEEYRSQIAHALRTARSNYAHFNPGSALSRSLKPFRQGTGDYNSLPSWDVVTRAVMSESPGLLGYEDLDAMQRLYDMVASGPPVRMPHEESYELAFSELKSSPLKDDKKDGKSFEEDFWGDDMPDTTTDDDEPIPFAKDAEDDDDNPAAPYLFALLNHADDEDMREAILETMHEDLDDVKDEDDFPPTQAAVAKVKKWMDELVDKRVKEWLKQQRG